KRPWPPERRATPNSGPQKARGARTTVAPPPISVALTAWARADTATPTASPVAATTVLAKRDVVADVNVGGEGGDDRTVLLEGEIDREVLFGRRLPRPRQDRKSTRLNSSHT